MGTSAYPMTPSTRVVPALAMAPSDLIVMFSSPPATLPGLGFSLSTVPNFDAYSLYQSTIA